MKKYIDAIGKACPIPFMLAKKEIDNNNQEFTIVVDNKGAVENLRRLAKGTYYSFSTEAKDNFFNVTFTSQENNNGKEREQEKSYKDEATIVPLVLQSWTLFISKDTMGEGDRELGINLLRMHLYTINANNDLPTHIICMNSGVHVATKDEQTIATLRALEEKGVSITVCGTCLDFYSLLDKLQVGVIGNMYDITKILTSSPKVVSI